MINRMKKCKGYLLRLRGDKILATEFSMLLPGAGITLYVYLRRYVQ